MVDILAATCKEATMADRRPLIQFRGDPTTVARLRVLEEVLGVSRTAVLQLGLECLVRERGLEQRVRAELERR